MNDNMFDGWLTREEASNMVAEMKSLLPLNTKAGAITAQLLLHFVDENDRGWNTSFNGEILNDVATIDGVAVDIEEKFSPLLSSPDVDGLSKFMGEHGVVELWRDNWHTTKDGKVWCDCHVPPQKINGVELIHK